MNIIEHVMSRPVITCGPHDSLHVAAGRLWEHDCGALPVTDEHGHVVGMITDRDICMAAYTKGKGLHAISVDEAMATRVITCRPTDAIADVERKMAQAQVRRLPVVDGQGRPVGLVSLNDLARLTAQASKRAAVEALGTLAAIGQPRRRAMTHVA